MISLKSPGTHRATFDQRQRTAKGVELIEKGLQSLKELRSKEGDGRHRRAFESRKKIIDACADLLASNRVPTSTGCARNAGVRERTVTHHFHSIEALCQTTIRVRPELKRMMLTFFNSLPEDDRALVLALGYYPAEVLARAFEALRKSRP